MAATLKTGRRGRRCRCGGFSLIELLIAVAIIMIILSVAIPSVRAMKQHTNATAAEGNLKTLATVLSVYASNYPNIGCPATLAALGPPASGSPASSSAADLVDESMAKAAATPKQGYLYIYTPVSGTPCTSYAVTANPQPGAATRYFFMDDTGAIHFNDNAPATAASPVIQ